MTTYAELKSDVDFYIARNDLQTTAPTLVRLAESRIREMVRCRDMETPLDLTINAQETPLPDDFLALVRIVHDTSLLRELTYVTPNEGWREAYNGGHPQKYTIEGNNLVFFPAPSDMDIKLLYFKAYAPLVQNNDTNWLLQNHYGIYLYSALTEAKALIEDDEQAAKWLTQFERCIERLNQAENRGRVGRTLKRGTDVP